MVIDIAYGLKSTCRTVTGRCSSAGSRDSISERMIRGKIRNPNTV